MNGMSFLFEPQEEPTLPAGPGVTEISTFKDASWYEDTQWLEILLLEDKEAKGSAEVFPLMDVVSLQVDIIYCFCQPLSLNVNAAIPTYCHCLPRTI